MLHLCPASRECSSQGPWHKEERELKSSCSLLFHFELVVGICYEPQSQVAVCVPVRISCFFLQMPFVAGSDYAPSAVHSLIPDICWKFTTL
jgi:hypothetical protein